ncbi:hypothetical protein P0D72_20450 [Paraburkholderia sediminicola]|uniref:hypothetical protein n=1 Tax=Paraburkholderia sediminicola TaxID=458836 RepID=UPI0038BA684A
MGLEYLDDGRHGGDIDRNFAEYVWVPEDEKKPVARAAGERVTIFFILAVCAWSLIETWLEIDATTDSVQLFALLVAKLIVLFVGGAAIYGMRAGSTFFSLLCGMSVLVLAPELPFLYGISHLIFVASLVECVLKACCLIALGCRHFSD